MWIPDFFKTLTSRIGHRRPTRRCPRASRSCCEALEDRCLLSFTAGVSYSVGNAPAAVATGDFNNDGRPDLVIANRNDNSVSVLLANAGGTFQSAQSSATGVRPQSVAVGDFNGDGKIDLATADDSDVSVLLGNGNGTFQGPSSVFYGSDPASVAVGDFNGDGKLDLGVACNSYYPPWSWGYYSYPGFYAGSASVLLGTGTGSFTPQFGGSAGMGFHTTAAIADFNNDGKQDIATGFADSGRVNVLLGTGTGELVTSLSSFGPLSQSIAAGDLNGDGKVDLLAANSYGDGVSVLLNSGNGTFSYVSERLYFLGSAATSAALADFNGDGMLDLVAADAFNSVHVLLGTGTGTFKSPVVVSTGDAVPGQVHLAVGDFNGDGRQDVAAVNSTSGKASVLFNNGIWPAFTSPSITINDVTVTEGNTGTTNATFTIRLSAASSQTITVHYATADGSATQAGNDFQATSGTLTFAPGQTSLTITVPVKGDRLVEEFFDTFFVKLDNPTNAFIADASGTGTIQDDEPSIQIVGSSVTEGDTGTRLMTLTMQLSAAYDAPVTVDWATSDFTLGDEWMYERNGSTAGVDYTATAGTVTFAPGVTSMPITINIIGDRVVETEEWFFVNVINANSARLGSPALASIVDDEPMVSINNSSSVVEGHSGTKPMTFTVTLSAASDTPVTVNYATSDWDATAGVDYVAATGTLTFSPGQTSKTFTVTIKGDRTGEYNEQFGVQLTGATGAGIDSAYSYGLIQDDEAHLSVHDASIVEGNSGTKQMTVRVTLAAAYDQTVTVRYRTDDWTTTVGEDYVRTSGTLTFAAGQTTKTFTITIKGDKKRESDERIFITIENPSANAVIDNYSAAGDILNDDGRLFRRAKKSRGGGPAGQNKSL